MKYLRKFDSVSDMETVITSSEIDIMGLAYNNSVPVMKIKSGSSPVPPTPSTSTPFYVENITQETETLTISEYDELMRWLEIPVECSTDGTNNWESLGTTGGTTLTKTLQPGEKVYLRAQTDGWMSEEYGICTINGVSKVGGNIMSLLYGSNFNGNETAFPSGSAGNFSCLFTNYFSEEEYNNVLIDASELILPATTLTENCYERMFDGCTSLATAPALPATTLAESCYSGMFSGCTNLNYIKCLATDISATDCTSGWVSGVASNGTFVKAASMSGWTTGTSGIPSGWTVQDATE